MAIEINRSDGLQVLIAKAQGILMFYKASMARYQVILMVYKAPSHSHC